MKSDIPGRMELAGLDLNSDEGLRQALASLPVRTAPPGLTTSLRVIASRERQRLAGRGPCGEMFARWCDHAVLAAKNVMRPLALPLAGGVFSAVALFSMLLLPTYPQRASASLDSPTMLNVGAVLVDVAFNGISQPIGLTAANPKELLRSLKRDIAQLEKLLQDS